MKYIILQGDGMADYPIESLGGKTPLEAAATPNMDWLASHGIFGLAHTIPEGFPPGSDVGNLSILGYDPKIYYTGRAPLEAASMGVRLGPEDIAFRCNLVALREDGKATIMEDFTAGHISSAEANEIIQDLNRQLGDDSVKFYPGVSYRHLMVWYGGRGDIKTTPPHDITDRETAPYLPEGDGAKFIRNLMERSKSLLTRHPINREREKRGERRATSIWLWGQGKAPNMPSLNKRFGINGAVISAVDLINGLGVYAGLERISVPGITGFIDTNFQGKGEYALEALRQKDLIFIHVEAPDEAGHMGDAAAKVKAIEAVDEKVLGTVLRGMDHWPDWRLLLLPDHATPVALKTHVSDPVPFVLYSSKEEKIPKSLRFNEGDAKKTGINVKKAYTLIEGLIKGRKLWIETSH
ncbi:MAG: cofactor-independent phosphoglycerate mutase [Deltaproteobacteria bacterium]|nr:cofactor-independent phosphoglycerate mutase [Deltaproteobacteria bacterium]MCZ6548518.1 cofactor-independent phosphoglycerate mutase [Deltaproteobacteria bacterium]MCZ6562717.1 cofactor-independent phosphoglycerate mutase [Deltaproteobacteria bacterium]MCZ6907756.1 cofactor-independent phosphoglycerate mutase [Deltaproteobacteria bacterium]